MRVRVLLFAALREAAGRSTCEIELGAGATVADLLARLEAEHAALRGARYALAVNRKYASTESPLAAGDEVALIPPVSGG